MIKTIDLNGHTIEYDLEYKNVKNINLRIKSDGSVHVSANRFTGINTIEHFLRLKADFIVKGIDSFKNRQAPAAYFTEAELKKKILAFCDRVYPYYEKRGVEKPIVKFRKMVSRWGSCNVRTGVITFSTNLKFADDRCVEYVIWHEFTHLIVPNHSKLFYNELEKVCSDWKECRKKLRKIILKR